MQEAIEQFISESNAIEGVFDENSFNQAMYAWHYLSLQEEITIPIMLKVHKILMLHQPLQPDERGYLRRTDVWVGGRKGKAPDIIRNLLEGLIRNIKDAVENGKKESKIWKEKICKEHHIIYEVIHPFIDGNGRTGRMFMNWERLKLGLPILIIKNSEKKDYYKWFKALD